MHGAHEALGYRSPKKDIHFPWGNNPSDFEGRITECDKKSKISIYSKDLWPTLRRFQPYPRGQGYTGGDDLVRELSKIANRKHTVGFTFCANVAGVRYPDISRSGGGTLAMPIPRWDRMKNEIIVARFSGNAKVHNYGHMEFFISMDEAGFIKSLPATAALHHFTTFADSVLKATELDVAKIIAARS